MCVKRGVSACTRYFGLPFRPKQGSVAAMPLFAWPSGDQACPTILRCLTLPHALPIAKKWLSSTQPAVDAPVTRPGICLCSQTSKGTRGIAGAQHQQLTPLEQFNRTLSLISRHGIDAQLRLTSAFNTCSVPAR